MQSPLWELHLYRIISYIFHLGLYPLFFTFTIVSLVLKKELD